MVWLIAAFLIAHGAVHLAIWLPSQPDDAEHQAPFAPDHSAVLTRTHMSPTTTHLLAERLAGATTIAYVVAGLGVGLGVALGAGWAVAPAVVAALLGLTLKILYFNPWLSLGLLLDAAVLISAVWAWPVSLT